MTWALYLLVLVAVLLLIVVVRLESRLFEIVTQLRAVSEQLQDINRSTLQTKDVVDKILDTCEIGFAEEIETDWQKTKATLKEDGIDV